MNKLQPSGKDWLLGTWAAALGQVQALMGIGVQADNALPVGVLVMHEPKAKLMDVDPVILEVKKKSLELMRRGRVVEAATCLEAAIREYSERIDISLYELYPDFAEAAALAGWVEKGVVAAAKSVELARHVQPGDAHPFTVVALNQFLAGNPAATYEALEKCRVAGFFFASPDVKYVSPGGTYENLSTICTPSLLAALGNCGVDVDAVLSGAAARAGSQVRRYPDGSVQIDGAGQEDVEAGALRYAHEMDWLLTGGEFELKARRRFGAANLDCPKGDGLHRYVIWFWEPWLGKAGDSHLRFGYAPCERTSVSILLKHRLSHADRLAFVDLLERWADSVRREGIFGEGPMEVCESAVEFHPKLARFRLEGKKPGPHTVVWLLICLLNFHQVSPTMGISIVGEMYGLWSFEPLKQNAMRGADASVLLHLRHGADARNSTNHAEGTSDGR